MMRRLALLTLAAMLALGACRRSKNGSASSGSAPSAPAKLPPGLPGQSEKELAEPVAVIDGTNITVAEVQDRINKQSPYVRARYTSMEQKKEFLDTLVRFEVLAKEARKRGYDADPEVVRTMKQVMIQKLLKDEFESKTKPEDIGDDEMKKYYDAHLSDYNKPEEVRVSAIIVKDKAKAEKAAAEAKQPANADNKAFRDLVDKYSEDADSKSRGGDLRFFAADVKGIPPEVVKASFTLKNTGDVAGPIQTAGGYYVLKQTGLRKAIAKSFDDVKRQIQNRLFRDKRTEAMEAFVSQLKKDAKIEIKEDSLAKVKVDTSQPAPMGGPGGPGGEPGEVGGPSVTPVAPGPGGPGPGGPGPGGPGAAPPAGGPPGPPPGSPHRPPPTAPGPTKSAPPATK
jgi:parvulin-like peptidyl-prolyl isomerase